MTESLSRHDQAAIALHDALVELVSAARAEHAAHARREWLRALSREANALFRAERAFQAFQLLDDSDSSPR